MRFWALLCLCAAAPSLAAVMAFSPEERARIEAHGPWPPAITADAGNRVDGRPEAVALGRQLFFERRLSASGELACASCHLPTRGFQDGRQVARHGRNTPGLLDVGLQRWFGWDGAADSLWAASLTPLTASDEIAATPETLLALLSADQALGARYRALFGAPAADHSLPVNLAKALAAYQATLISRRTPFDDFRDALLRGDQARAARYPEAAQRGLKLFIGEGRCFFCHTGPSFTNGEFADVGRPFFTAAGADPGRWGGLQQLTASPFNRLGTFSDTAPDDSRAIGTRHVLLEPRHYGEFKVPGLRGLMATAPYFHDGSAPDLDAVVRHYAEFDESRLHADGTSLLRPLKLTPTQAADLTVFLKSLSAPARAQALPRHKEPTRKNP